VALVRDSLCGVRQEGVWVAGLEEKGSGEFRVRLVEAGEEKSLQGAIGHIHLHLTSRQLE
jgi:hypothetical protein